MTPLEALAKFPDVYRYICCNKKGFWFVHEKAPQILNNRWHSNCSVASVCSKDISKSKIKFCGDWRRSLFCRDEIEDKPKQKFIDWQPIGTAPDEPKELLVCAQNKRMIFTTSWHGIQKWKEYASTDKGIELTHWANFPNLPEKTKK